ncbi:MAG: endonuclease/exonuclease/phosphatase family protein [Rhizobiaceae bacterium]
MMSRPVAMRVSLVTTLLLSLPLVAGFLGALHPAFDSFAHFRVHLAALMMPAALPLFLSRWWAHGIMALVLGGAAIVSALGLPALGVGQVHAGFERKPLAARGYRLMQFNLRYDHPDPERVVVLLDELRPDFVLLEEVSDMWAGKLRGLTNLYPYQLRCGRTSGVGGTAILSQEPFGIGRMTECAGDGSLAIAQVELDSVAVDLAALHLGWPWPFGQSRQVTRLTPDLASLGQNAILAGDLNAAPWSRTARRVMAAGALTPMESPGPTWLSSGFPAAWRPWIGLPIDHVFAKGDVVLYSGHTLPEAGSDHLPILIEFGIRAPEQAPGAQITVLTELSIAASARRL